jgi:hypothetical protein
LEDTWEFHPPTVIIKSVQLLRESQHRLTQTVKRLIVVPDSSSDQTKATLLAQALDVPCVDRDTLPSHSSNTAVLRVGVSRYKAMDFVSPDETKLLGPAMKVKHFLTRPMGEPKRW